MYPLYSKWNRTRQHFTCELLNIIHRPSELNVSILGQGAPACDMAECECVQPVDVASLKETQTCNIRLNLPYEPINSGSVINDI